MSPDPMAGYARSPFAHRYSDLVHRAVCNRAEFAVRRAQIARFCCTLAGKRTTLIGDEQASGVSRGLVARGPWLCMTACGRSG
jgi:hypothetical protein